jgi:hypothetical protein
LPEELKQKQDNVIAGTKAGIINMMKVGDSK